MLKSISIVKLQTPNSKRQTPNAKLQTPNCKSRCLLWSVAIGVLLALSSAQPLVAQDTGTPGQRGRGGRVNDPATAADMRPIDVMNVLDGYAIVQAQEALELADTQYGQFVTRLKKLQETRRRSHQARNRIIQELRKLAGPAAPQAPDETAIKTQIQALRDHDHRAAEEINKAYDAVDEVLDPRQQARFRLFEERLELRKMDLLMRARQGAARRQNR
jgi:hypothetical protein